MYFFNIQSNTNSIYKTVLKMKGIDIIIKNISVVYFQQFNKEKHTVQWGIQLLS